MRVRLSLLILAIALTPVVILAQTETRPFMAGLSANFMDYNGPMTGDYTQFSTYDPGISFAGYGYISKSFNYSLSTTFAPEVIYPMTENTTISTSMLDVKGMIRWTIVSPDKFFVPYLGTGFGLNTAANNLRVYVPGSVGFRLRFSENFGLQWESTWQQRLKSNQFQPASHMLGFVFSLPATRKPKQKNEEREQITDSVAELPDRDSDGVPDRDDQCPDIKGLHMYLGCPEPEQEGMPEAETGTIATEVSTPSPFFSVPNESEPSVTSLSPETSLSIGFGEQQLSQSELAALNMELQNIYFDHASFELTSEAYATLNRAAKLMRDYPELELQVMGHADKTGSERGNIVLSIKRAYTVKYYLVYEKKIPMSRIASDGYSSVEPVGANETEQGRAMNRRVELQLTRKQAANAGASIRGKN